MARIKIEDLPVLEELTREEMQSIFGGDGLVDTEIQPVVEAATGEAAS